MRSFDEWFDENCDGSDLAKDACRKLWNEFSDQINIICRKSYEKQQAKVDELQYKAKLRESDHQALLVKYQATKKCWEDMSNEKDELQKLVDISDLKLIKLSEFIYGSGDLREYSDEELLKHQRSLKAILAEEQALKVEKP